MSPSLPSSSRRPSRGNPVGVLLMAFGSPASVADIAGFLGSVRGGRAVTADAVVEFRRRYDLVGGSPLVQATEAQRQGLQRELDRCRGAGAFVVVAGMRHSSPAVTQAVDELLQAGVTEVLAVVLSPQQSQAMVADYAAAVEGALLAARARDLEVRFAPPWYQQKDLVRALSVVTAPLYQGLVNRRQGKVSVIATAHSLPLSWSDSEPRYSAQVEETSRLLGRRLGARADEVQVAYQSAGPNPQAWLGPQLQGAIEQAAADGARHVLVVPVQFLCDHLEVRYDLDVLAKAAARAVGVGFTRAPTVGASPLLVSALAHVVMEATVAGPGPEGLRLTAPAAKEIGVSC